MWLTKRQIEIIKNLGLPDGTWSLVGGASLAIRGIRDVKKDIDILLHDDIYDALLSYANKEEGPWLEQILSENGFSTLVLKGSFLPIELLPLSHFEDRTVTFSYITNSEIIEGLPVILAQDMLQWKRAANRPKDQEDIVLLEKYLAHSH